jgi:hypothetical protein
MWRMEEQGLKNPQLSWFSGISARPGPVHKKLIGLNSKKKNFSVTKFVKKPRPLRNLFLKKVHENNEYCAV